MKSIQDLIAQMTLEEKAGLLSGLDFWHTKPVERLGVRSVMVSDGPHGLRKQAQTGDHLGVNESIEAVCFPAACAAAASFDRALFRTLGEALGEECQAEQVAVILGPAVNIKRSPLCGRNFEYLSEDPYLAGEAAAAYTGGVQSKNIGVSLKHFAANNQECRRMSSSSEADERTLREIYFPAFEAAVRKAHAWTVMCSYNRINGVYASENHWLLTDVLRSEWGFDGYVMSDWSATADRVEGIRAGLDLEMPSSNGVRDRLIVDAVRNGTLDEALVDQACERILRVNERYLENAKPDTVWDKEAHDLLSGQLAEECMVLLKNENGILPLIKGDAVAFIGEFAEKPRFQGGGSSHIHCTRITSALDAARDIAGVRYARGFDVETDTTSDALMAGAVSAAAAARIAVVFAGLPDAYESEGYDRTHMRLPESQNRVIEAVAAANPRTVVVLHNGSPVEMPWLPRVQGVLEAYLGGQAAGRAVVRLLYGDANPSGRLAETFPLKLEDNPSYLFYGGKEKTEYREGVFVGYRYYDKKKMDVLFPFGHGLSYTDFAYSNLRLSASEITDSDTLTVSVDLTNTGMREGSEAVQLYVSDLESTPMRPLRELKGFEKVALRPNETKTVSFVLERRAFAYYEESIHDWYVESGDFAIEIGRSSRDIALSATVTVHACKALPVVYDRSSILLDIMANPKGRALIDAFTQQTAQALGASDDDLPSKAAQEAITGEMQTAMMQYMPLNAAVTFGGVSYEQIDALLAELNRPPEE